MQKKQSIFHIIETLAILGLLAFFYVKDLASVPFHIDESHWIGTSYMFEAYFKGEFWSDAWRDNQHTVTNPPVPRYLIGISRFIGGYRIPDLNRPWDYTRSVGFNERAGAVPSDQLLWWSRLPMAILAVLSIWIGFLLIQKIGGRIPAYIWIIFGIASPYLLLQTRRAMAESAILFFVMLGAFLCFLALKKLDEETGSVHWKVYLYLTLCGLCLGLAAEAKINGLAALAGVLLSILIVVWKKQATLSSKIRRVFLLSVLVSTVTLVAFVGSYPYLWPNPLGRSVRVFQNRLDEMKYQTTQHTPDALNTISQKLTVIPMRIFNDYAILNFNGAIVLNIILTILGLGILLKNLGDWFKTGTKNGPAVITLFAVAVAASFPSLFTLLDWDRYYLFPVFFSSMAIAIGMGWLLQKLYQRLVPAPIYKGG